MARQLLSRSLFDARWLMVPFYIGLIAALAALLFVFARELFKGVLAIASMTPTDAILLALALIDLSLVANLLLIVVLAGYENFVGRVDSGREARPTWMGTVDFAGMKIKLMGSITAISAIALLRIFMKLEEGTMVDERTLLWMTVIHAVLIFSALVLSVSDRIAEHRRQAPTSS
jgi:uncharacterized protein (TIGR00645 family)